MGCDQSNFLNLFFKSNLMYNAILYDTWIKKVIWSSEKNKSNNQFSNYIFFHSSKEVSIPPLNDYFKSFENKFRSRRHEIYIGV